MNGPPSALRTSSGSCTYRPRFGRNAMPSAARRSATARSRRRPYGAASRVTYTSPAPSSRASAGTTSAGRPGHDAERRPPLGEGPGQRRDALAHEPGPVRGRPCDRGAAARRTRTAAPRRRPPRAPRSARGGRARGGRGGTRRSRCSACGSLRASSSCRDHAVPARPAGARRAGSITRRARRGGRFGQVDVRGAPLRPGRGPVLGRIPGARQRRPGQPGGDEARVRVRSTGRSSRGCGRGGSP